MVLAHSLDDELGARPLERRVYFGWFSCSHAIISFACG
jgi:hypothetical protein